MLTVPYPPFSGCVINSKRLHKLQCTAAQVHNTGSQQQQAQVLITGQHGRLSAPL